ncbi:hypothetical protein BG011_003350, partial [Mortierella polycephala]
MDPHIDRHGHRQQRTPETDLLKWIQARELYDSFRCQHPIAREYTFEDKSRLDMIFTSSRLATRLLKIGHVDMTNIAPSDHRLVLTSLTLQGNSHLTRQQTQVHSRQAGFRFSWRETTSEHWTEFSEMVTTAVELHKERLAEQGLLTHEGMDQDRDRKVELRQVKLEAGWRIFSSLVMDSARATIPGKKVGRSGVKPSKEITLLHLTRSLAR